MRYVHRNLVLILLSIIVLVTGMCSEIERTDSCLVSQNYSSNAETLETIKNNTIYIGNCTNKLITGLRETFQRSRRGQGKISLRGNAEFIWMKEILHLCLFFCITVAGICTIIQSDSSAILNYIHNQDGEK